MSNTSIRLCLMTPLLTVALLTACRTDSKQDSEKNDSDTEVVVESDAVHLTDSGTETETGAVTDNPDNQAVDVGDSSTGIDSETGVATDSDSILTYDSATATGASDTLVATDSDTTTVDDSDTTTVDDSEPQRCDGAPPLALKQMGVCEGVLQICGDAWRWVEPDYALIATYEATEVTCDGLDNDCDGQVDDGLATALYYEDADGDGFGARATEAIASCVTIAGYVNNALDCDDTNEQIFPNALERCNGRDDNCDGAVDETFPEVGEACDSADSDLCENGIWVCSAFGSNVICQESVVNLAEICSNGVDDNCDGIIDEDIDMDSDGWGTCEGDCCDNTNCSPKPHLVNPGAFEFVGNGLDDDCDPATSDTEPTLPCSNTPLFSAVDGWAVAAAMDLCQVTTDAPLPAQRKWGVIAVELLLADGSEPTAEQLLNMQNFQAAVLENYGSEVLPQYGATMAGLSSGRMRDEGDPDYVIPQSGTPFDVYGFPPPDYLAAHGGQLPSTLGCSGDCPVVNNANDAINVRMTIRVPTNAQSFSYKVKFYSAEYPDFICSTYNDFYLALLQSESPDIPDDKNISFDSLGNPLSVNNGFFTVCDPPTGCYTCDEGPLELTGTGMANDVGGGTQWLLTSAPVMPGETIVLELMIFDVGDGILDSLVLLDDFRWDIDPAEPGTVVIIE